MTVSVTHAQQISITTTQSNSTNSIGKLASYGSTTGSGTHHHHPSYHHSPSHKSSAHSNGGDTIEANNNSSHTNAAAILSQGTMSSLPSTATTALRRLYFKSGRKPKQTPTVPKVVVMGSSSTSEATINTSTESASTLVTNITATTDTDNTVDSLDLCDTSGQSEPLLSSSIEDPLHTSIFSDSDSFEKEDTNSILTSVIVYGERDTVDSSNEFNEEIPLHPFKSPQTAPLATSTRFPFDPPSSPKSVRTYEKNRTLFTFDDQVKDNERKSSTDSSSRDSSKETSSHRRRSQHKGRYSSSKEKLSSSNHRHSTAHCHEYSDENSAMFPFDREAIDYDRIQRECFAVEDETKFTFDFHPNNYEKQTRFYDQMRSPSDLFHQYTLLSQEEKCYRSSKYDHMSPVFNDHHLQSNSPRSASPIPDLRVDFFSESVFTAVSSSSSSSTQQDDSLAGVQKYTHNGCGGMSVTTTATINSGNGGAGGGGPINVTPNPMDTAVYTQPRATIVVQQASLSLDNSVETYLLKNEGDFISVEHGKELRKKKQREENMRQLLDVTNKFTSEEIRDFEMRYGSPHHCRSQSVKTPGSRASGRPNQLTLPQQRSRVASMPNTGVEEEYYRLRHFSITGKGVINRGDSLKSRRSRSNNSVASSNSSTEHLTAVPVQSGGRGGESNTASGGGGSSSSTIVGCGGGRGGSGGGDGAAAIAASSNSAASTSVKTSATCSLASSRESSTSNPGAQSYKVLMLGGSAVGKSSLVSQFMTSEYLHAYDTSIDDDTGEKSVSVLLSGEESELVFIDHPHTEMMPDNCFTQCNPHGFCVIYSTSDKGSFGIAERILQTLWTSENISQKAVILVGNKADLARSRVISSEEGKSMATAYDCKFIETSVGINHNVDELLVGILSQIRLKLENPEKSRDLFRKRSTRKSKRRACSPLGTATACLSGNAGTTTSTPVTNITFNDFSTPPGSTQSSPRKYRGSRTSASLKVKGLLGRVWARDSKSKSCENLHVL